jgi:hemerythrin superfamily protein
MDAIEWIERDHKKLRSLLSEFVASETSKRSRTLFEAVRSEFDAHADAEERVLYPWCERFDESKYLVHGYQREHQAVRDRFAELARLKDEELSVQARALEALFLSHIDKEEKEMFPAIRKIARRPEREQLGRHLESARHEFEAAA